MCFCRYAGDRCDHSFYCFPAILSFRFRPTGIHSGKRSNIQEADLGVKDPLFEEAAKLVVNSQQGSTSSIQRRFSIGYNRAGRIVDQLEAAGIVGPFEGSKARQVLIPDEYSLELLLKNLGDKF